ncbi:sugar phosphate isomerase/epimerase family protein [Novosphingobium album (ex Liu et al. 2023)]|uniref:TIM barrel protein n=1 Tax=Novosphingobium album (ex Liu et al. 2023) TaxID=3031130 RepID=A0ABT5WWA9_9SPHN|nr:TIM barrel protein [Novosphingobium album (ex Liu et al. 2023)]MDE8654141.1 TIM barrel protein [Novosphingobium album (ex Liu et al. 2023)]
MNRIGIERLCVFGMPPVDFIRLAAALGGAGVGIGFTPINAYNPHGYPDWSLRDDPALRRETRAALADSGVAITLLEGFAVVPDKDVRDQERDLDLAAELGAERINLVSMDRDRERTGAGFAVLTEMAAARGIKVSTEIGTGPLRTLDRVLAVLDAVAHPNLTLLIDTMHFFRFGSSLETLAGLPAETIGYVQLCDVPLVSPFESYLDEAFHDRLVPGEGELPLAELLALVPPDVVISVEVPRRAAAQAGAGPAARIAPCVDAARAMLASLAGR